MPFARADHTGRDGVGRERQDEATTEVVLIGDDAYLNGDRVSVAPEAARRMFELASDGTVERYYKLYADTDPEVETA